LRDAGDVGTRQPCRQSSDRVRINRAETWIAAAALLAGFARLAADTPWPALRGRPLLSGRVRGGGGLVRLDHPRACARAASCFGAFLWGAVVPLGQRRWR
jgi:hypothetical protein